MQVGVGMPDRESFENFARDMLGFPVGQSPDGKITYVRPDRYRHRIAARTAPEPVLHYVGGFDVGGPPQLADWKTKLTTEGVDWRHGSAAGCTERHVNDFIEFSPDGHRVLCRTALKSTERARALELCSVQRLGHVLLTVTDTQRTHDFYTGVLGFRLSDWVCIDDNVRLWFPALRHAPS